MNFKKTLLLGIVLLGCVLYLIRFEIPKRDEAERKGFAFAKLDGVQLERLSIKRAKNADKPDLDIAMVNTQPAEKAAPTPTPVRETNPLAPQNDDDDRALGAWELDGVSGAGLDPVALRPVISALQTLKLDDPIPSDQVGSDLGVFGLKDPVATIEVKRLGSEKRSIYLGIENEYLMKRYFKVEGDNQIYLASPGIFAAINKPKSDFREKKPIDFNDLDIRSVTLGSSKGTLKAQQAGRGNWSLEEPIKLPGSEKAFMTLFSTLKSLRADEFFDDGDKKLTEYGLDSPRATINLEFKNTEKFPKPVKVRMSQKAGDETAPLYLSLEGKPTVYRIPQGKIEPFIRETNDLRERELTKFFLDKLKTAEFGGSDIKPIKIVNQGESWKVNDKEADTIFVDQVLYNLRDMEAADFVKNGLPIKFDAPRLTIKLVLDELKAEETKTLVVGDKVPGVEPTQYYARVTGVDDVFTIQEDAYKRIRPIEEALIKRADPDATASPVAVQ